MVETPFALGTCQFSAFAFSYYVPGSRVHFPPLNLFSCFPPGGEGVALADVDCESSDDDEGDEEKLHRG